MLPPVTVSQNNFKPTKGDLVRRYSCSGIWHSDAVVDSYSNNILTVDWNGILEQVEEFSLSYEYSDWFWRLLPEG